ncbi:MAG: hypothetical protein A2138_14800 [Deltaproteobacteria bacterium RBG_16_71_12]|nr:MAG: hypothetical protein A2138_14800 [Deltaproteobacteria bacterium RBG_16_71_12]
MALEETGRSKIKTSRARRSFTPELRAQAVELVRSSGKTAGQVAKDLDLTETALREQTAPTTTAAPRSCTNHKPAPRRSGASPTPAGAANRAPPRRARP